MQQHLPDIRHNWTRDEVHLLFELSFNDLLFRAQKSHRENFDPCEVQISTLMSIKTGACPEKSTDVQSEMQVLSPGPFPDDRRKAFHATHFGCPPLVHVRRHRAN